LEFESLGSEVTDFRACANKKEDTKNQIVLLRFKNLVTSVTVPTAVGKVLLHMV
jgi:hypothetical protein